MERCVGMVENNGFSINYEFIVIALGNKPEENFRKVAEKGIRAYIVEYADEKNAGFCMSESSSNKPYMDDIKDKVREALGIENFYFDVIGVKSIHKDNTQIGITMQVMVIIRQNETNLVNKDQRYKGNWVWVTVERDMELVPKSIKLVDNPDKPKVYIDSLFEDQIKDLLKAVEHVRYALEFTNIAFEFMPKLFTLKEFEEVYNALNAREVTNMKKKWAYKFEDSGRMSNGLAHRPAKLYKLKEA